MVFCCSVVSTGERAVIERCGAFTRVGNPGCNCLIPCVDGEAGRVSMRLQQIDVKVETKTKDNVFVVISCTVQYIILDNYVENAFYRLQDPVSQITAYIHNSIRGQVPQYNIDQMFEVRKEIADSMKNDLDSHMNDYGFDITAALISDVEPAPVVKRAMNEINTSQRLRAAASDKAEADKIRVVKKAEAEAEAKRLSGVGLAQQRQAIVSGLQRSVEEFSVLGDLSNQQVMTMVLMTQYFDALKDLAEHTKGSSMLLSHSPGASIDSIVKTINQGWNKTANSR